MVFKVGDMFKPYLLPFRASTSQTVTATTLAELFFDIMKPHVSQIGRMSKKKKTDDHRIGYRSTNTFAEAMPTFVSDFLEQGPNPISDGTSTYCVLVEPIAGTTIDRQ